jgi:hypothetical protein
MPHGYDDEHYATLTNKWYFCSNSSAILDVVVAKEFYQGSLLPCSTLLAVVRTQQKLLAPLVRILKNLQRRAANITKLTVFWRTSWVPKAQ